jgi:aspartate racemase
MRKLGLVGGISWVSTIDYYRFINEGVNQRLGGLNYAELLLYSINFEEFQRNNSAGDWEATYRLIRAACENLRQGGAEGIVLCANTAHVVADRVAEAVGLPVIHIADVTAGAIRQRGLHKVGLLGTKFTMEMDFYRDRLQSHGIEVIVPAQQEVRDFIQRTVRDELGRGVTREDTKRAYIAIVRDLVAHGAEGIVLGCTEIPLLISQEDFVLPVFDTTRIHARAAVEFALSA